MSQRDTDGQQAPYRWEKDADVEKLMEEALSGEASGQEVPTVFADNLETRLERCRRLKAEVGRDREIFEQLANFNASVEDLMAIFGSVNPDGTETQWGDQASTVSQIRALITEWQKTGLIELNGEKDGAAVFYIATDLGMIRAGLPDWHRGLFANRDASRLDRGGARGRLLASVGAALALDIRTDEAHLDFELLSVWGIRQQRRQAGKRYRFEINVSGRRHCPVAVLDPFDKRVEKPTVIEVFDGSLAPADVQKVCRSYNHRKDVGYLRCYTTEQEDLRILRELVREMDMQQKVAIYAIPEGAGALEIANLEPEFVPSSAELTKEELALRLAILKCLSEFGSASSAGLREYFSLTETQIERLIGSALRDGLIEQPKATCDNVKINWLTADGAKLTKRKISRAPVTFKQARMEKEILRIFSSVRARYPSRHVTTARILARARKLMPVIGPAELGYRPALLVSRGSKDRSPVAIVVLIEMRTEAQLKEMVDACISDRKMSHIFIYANRQMVEILRAILGRRDKSNRITLKPLPPSERTEHVLEDERKRRRRASHEAVVKQRKEEAQSRKTTNVKRSEVHVIALDGMKPFGGGFWREWEDMLNGAGHEQAPHGVSMRLVVNLRVWLAERSESIGFVTTDTCGMSTSTFKKALVEIDERGLWQPLQDLVETYIEKEEAEQKEKEQKEKEEQQGWFKEEKEAKRLPRHWSEFAVGRNKVRKRKNAPKRGYVPRPERERPAEELDFLEYAESLRHQ
jgi:hypothetical protein